MGLSIRKREEKSPHWYLYGTVEVGKLKRRIPEHSLRTTNKKLAEKVRRRMETEIENELVLGIEKNPKHDITLGAAHDMWMNVRDPSRPDRSRAKVFVEFFGRDYMLADFNETEWARFKSTRLAKLSSNSLVAYATIIRTIFKESGFGEAPKLQFQKKQKWRDVTMTTRQANKLLKSYSDVCRGPATVARYSGLRAGEIALLKKSDVDLERNLIIVRSPKNGKDRRVPMHPQVRKEVEAAMASSLTAFVFEKSPGKPWPYQKGESKNPFFRHHERARAKVDMHDFRWHDWRHYFAWNYLRFDPNIYNLMAVAGWTDPKVAMRYLSAHMDRCETAIKQM